MDTSNTSSTAATSGLGVQSRQDWRRATVSGYAWSIVTQVSRGVSQLVVMALLARSLGPEEIGIVGLTLVVINILMVVNEVGLGGGIIQRERLEAQSLSTLFWLGWGLGFLQFGLIQVGAGAWGAFAHHDAAVSVIRWLSLGVLFAAVGAVPNSLLIRTMRFRKVAMQELVASLVAGIVAIAMAVAGFGLWSLVAWTLIQVGLRALLAFWQSGWYPQRVFSTGALSDLWSFGAYYALTRLFSIFAGNLDFVVVGKLVSVTALGYYTLAFNLSRTPSRLLDRIVNKVAFSSFARIQADQDLGRKAYLLKLGLTTAAVLPLSVILVVFPHLIVRLIYGPGWEETAQLLRILAITTTAVSMGSLRGPVLLGNGRADWLFYLNVANAVMLGLAVLGGGLIAGVYGVAWAVTGSMLISFIVGQGLVNLTIHTTIIQVVQAIWPSLTAGLAMAITIWFSKSMLSQLGVAEPIIIAILSALAGVSAYLACLMTHSRYRRLLKTTAGLGYEALTHALATERSA